MAPENSKRLTISVNHNPAPAAELLTAAFLAAAPGQSRAEVLASARVLARALAARGEDLRALIAAWAGTERGAALAACATAARAYLGAVQGGARADPHAAQDRLSRALAPPRPEIPRPPAGAAPGNEPHPPTLSLAGKGRPRMTALRGYGPGGSGPWMQTASGGRFHFANPRAQSPGGGYPHRRYRGRAVEAVPVRGALPPVLQRGGAQRADGRGGVGRGGGARLRPGVRPGCGKALRALMHDAAEAYVGDMIRPLKAALGPSPHANWEIRIAQLIGARHGLPPDPRHGVGDLDLRMLKTEALAFGWDVSAWDAAVARAKPLPATLEFWPPAEAESRFIELFHDLGEVEA